MKKITPNKAPSPAEVCIGNYRVGKTLGEGSFAKVRYATHVETNQIVAIKMFEKEHMEEHGIVDQVKNGIKILHKLNHANIIKLLDVHTSKTHVFQIMEVAAGGDLYDRIINVSRYEESDSRKIFFQLVSALQHCAEQGICHRDLKAENILLTIDGDVKLVDFDFAKFTSETKMSTTCGTPNYVSPEILKGVGYAGGPADIWAAGVILYLMNAGFLPFDEQNLVAMFRKIIRVQIEYPHWFSQSLISLCHRIFDPNPNTRATASEIMRHEWLQGVCDSTVGRSISAHVQHDGGLDEMGSLNCSISPRIVFPSPLSLTQLDAFDVIAIATGAAMAQQLTFKSSWLPRVTHFTLKLPSVTASVLWSRFMETCTKMSDASINARGIYFVDLNSLREKLKWRIQMFIVGKAELSLFLFEATLLFPKFSKVFLPKVRALEKQLLTEPFALAALPELVDSVSLDTRSVTSTHDTVVLDDFSHGSPAAPRASDSMVEAMMQMPVAPETARQRGNAFTMPLDRPNFNRQHTESMAILLPPLERQNTQPFNWQSMEAMLCGRTSISGVVEARDTEVEAENSERRSV